MTKAVLLRDVSKEGSKAAGILRDAGVEFREVFSEDGNPPVLIVPDRMHSYKGVEDIKNYIKR